MTQNTYPFNLIRAIYSDDKDNNTHTDTVYLKGFHEQVNALTDLEQRIIYLRFEQSLTYEDCAKELEISAVKTSAILRKILNKLRAGWRQQYYQGVSQYEHVQLKRKIEKLETDNRLLTNAFRQLDDSDVDPKLLARMTQIIRPEHLSIQISSLDLSTRTGNALFAGGYRTIKDVLAASEKELKDLPNFGAKCWEEVSQKVRAHILLPADFHVKN